MFKLESNFLPVLLGSDKVTEIKNYRELV